MGPVEAVGLQVRWGQAVVPVETVLSLAAAVAVANVVLLAAVVLGPLLRPEQPEAGGAGGALETPPPDALGAGLPSDAFDRVVRVAGWAFIVVAMFVVALGGFWPERQEAILVLLALAGLGILLVHDLLPLGVLGAWKYAIVGSLALTFAALLVLLTGQAASPFFFAFPLIVGGAALALPGPAVAAFTGLAGVAYLAAALAPIGGPPLDDLGLATVAVNFTALGLIAYVAAMVVAEHRRSRDEAIRLSTIDALTGLFNRSFFFAAVEREIARSDRSGRGFCILMIDLDDLKLVNDRFGHFVGDRLLEAVARVIGSRVRRIDIAARYGGDEFVVLLPETDVGGGLVLAEKIRQGATALRIPIPGGSPIRASLSIGVAAYPTDGATADELLSAADQAMYVSKRAGRDRVSGTMASDRATDVGAATAIPIHVARWQRIEVGVGRLALRR
jgi:diguanylate cyclase